MVLLLLLVVLAVPVIEIYLMIQMGSAIGALPTVALLVLIAALGVVIVKQEGLGIVRRLQTQVRQGDDPGNDLLDGVLIVLAGVLLIIPGFVSDIVALLLLVPPVRRFARASVARRVQARLAAVVSSASVSGYTSGTSFGTTRVYDTRVVENLGDVTPPQWRHPSSDPRSPGGPSGGNELSP